MATQTQAQSQTQTSTDKAKVLRWALLANVFFSAMSGIEFILFPSIDANFFGFEGNRILGLMNGDMFLRSTGVDLLIWAAIVWFVSSRPTINIKHVYAIIALDMVWVLGTVAILLTDALTLTTNGSWVLLAKGDVVLTLAVLQYWGIRRMK